MMKIGISGDIGSFSEEAALTYAKKSGMALQLVYLLHIEGVLSAVSSGDVDMGIFPVVNVNGGLVKSAFQAMGNHLFTVITDFWLEINHCLLVLPQTSLTQISRITSHEQAFKQCQNYLKKEFNTIPQDEAVNTAKAARDLAEGHLSATTAVIASERTAEIYHLKVVAKHVQDKHPNLTAFVLIKRHVKTTKEA